MVRGGDRATGAEQGGDAVDAILAQWARERPDLDCAPMGVIGRISQLQREVFLAQRATFARHGLDAPSFDVLAALRRARSPAEAREPLRHEGAFDVTGQDRLVGTTGLECVGELAQY